MFKKLNSIKNIWLKILVYFVACIVSFWGLFFVLGYYALQFIKKLKINKNLKFGFSSVVVLFSLFFGSAWIVGLSSPSTKKIESGTLDIRRSSSSSTQASVQTSSISQLVDSSSSTISSSLVAPANTPKAIIPAVQNIITTYPTIQQEPAQQEVTEIIQDTQDTGLLLDVKKVVDGDTVSVSQIGKLRLIGIDTPELKDPRKPVQCFALEASNKAKELLNGRKVYLVYNPVEKLDKYNRTLAYVFRDDGLDFNAEMIKLGYAQAYTKYPHPRLDEFVKYGQQARENKLGLWSDTTCAGEVNQQYSNNEQKKEQAIIPVPVPKIEPKPIQKIVEETAVQQPQNPTNDLPYFANCKEYLANGIFNITKDDPRYKPSLDGDKDGFACEPKKK